MTERWMYMVWIMIKDMYYQIQKEVNLITDTGLNGLVKKKGNFVPTWDFSMDVHESSNPSWFQRLNFLDMNRGLCVS
jgi:hypothetical protein